MSAKKETQVEDSPLPEKMVEEPKSEVKTETKAKKSFVSIALPWLIVAVVFFLGGLAVLYFTIYKTATANLAASMETSAQLSEKLSSAEVELQTAKTDLLAAEASLAEKTAAYTLLEKQSILYKFQADVNGARASLLNQDPASARQNLTFVAADLAALEKTDIDPQSLTGLQPRIDTALENLETDPQKAADALYTLSSNLTMITNNLK